ncbi:hypothetical protein [Streptococcus pneumoniae]|uniref:hypothetical protein n=1 Tax=Streptococcus pneumoniae TaxID=1313 RepID=UPI000A730317|nr:hypothetical protein [Streptococcus pneumoniae]
MKIKEQTRKLAQVAQNTVLRLWMTDEVSLKYCFEVVDRTDEVSLKHRFEVADRLTKSA